MTLATGPGAASPTCFCVYHPAPERSPDVFRMFVPGFPSEFWPNPHHGRGHIIDARTARPGRDGRSGLGADHTGQDDSMIDLYDNITLA